MAAWKAAGELIAEKELSLVMRDNISAWIGARTAHGPPSRCISALGSFSLSKEQRKWQLWNKIYDGMTKIPIEETLVLVERQKVFHSFMLSHRTSFQKKWTAHIGYFYKDPSKLVKDLAVKYGFKLIFS